MNALPKILMTVAILFTSQLAMASGSLPFEPGIEAMSLSMQNIMYGIAIIAIVAFAIYAILGEGGGLAKLSMIVVFGALGLSAASVLGVLFGVSGAAGALF